MITWITSGQIALAIIALTVVEIVILYVIHHLFRRGLAPADFLPSILAGDFLLLAWFTNTSRFSWSITAAALLAALLCHLTDMARRLVGATSR